MIILFLIALYFLNFLWVHATFEIRKCLKETAIFFMEGAGSLSSDQTFFAVLLVFVWPFKKLSTSPLFTECISFQSKVKAI